jgi:hypothetical protein
MALQAPFLLLTAAAAVSAAPCDIYAAGGTPCVAAHSMTRALYSAYAGALYQLQRTPGNATKDIAVRGVGGKADSATHAAFCRGGTCTVERIYDQSPRGNHLGIEQGLPFLKGQPRGAHDRAVEFSDPRSKAVLGGQEIYAAYFEGVGDDSKHKSKDFVGQGYSNRTAIGTAVGDEPQSMYAVLSGRTFNGGCCFECANNALVCCPSPGVAVWLIICCVVSVTATPRRLNTTRNPTGLTDPWRPFTSAAATSALPSRNARPPTPAAVRMSSPTWSTCAA